MFQAVAEFRAHLAWLGRPTRVLLAILGFVAILVGSFSWQIEPFGTAERILYDGRNALNMPSVDQDNRIVQIAYSDETLLQTGKRSPLDRAILAKALKIVDGLAPKGIAIDILIDQPQAEDSELFNVLRSLKTPTRLAYDPTEHGVGTYAEFQTNFMKSVFENSANPNLMRGNLAVESDDDYVARLWPPLQDRQYSRLVDFDIGPSDIFQDYEGPIRYRKPISKDRPVFSALPIELLVRDDMWRSSDSAALIRNQIHNRYVIIGGRLSDVDVFQTPISRFTSIQQFGIDLHSHMLAQRLDGIRLFEFSRIAVGISALSSLLLGLATGMVTRRLRSWIFSVVGAVLLFGLAGLGVDRILGQSYGVNQLGWFLAWISGAGLAVAVRRAANWEKGITATSALFSYLPRDIAKSITQQPERLGLKGDRKQIFALFTDLEGFTKLCQAVEPERMAEFLNEYLEAISQAVLAHGGTIDKFVGDAVVAFWGAPVARDDDGERAVRAALAIHDVTRRFQGRDIGGDLPVGRTRIGLHYGPAIIGNFGGEGRLQYTALGDTMNVAARLEAANKQLETGILISLEVREHAPDIPCVALGTVSVRGRSKPIDIFEPDTGLGVEAIAKLNAASHDELEAWSARNPQAPAIANFVRRMHAGETAEAPTQIG